MALEQYNKKRRFDRTPEPEGKVERGEGHRFVVQKHRASHLHYDFRLEMDGVLKSWAVPKGPSLNPGDKRLAMQVEDHPVSYFHFEGRIPQGNYGAGTVMVWDTGTWDPQGDEHKMLNNGDLKFRLNGEKLKGEFVLARMRSRRPGSKGTEWLLIKKKDEAMQPGFNIDNLDYSALTRRTLAEIAGDERSAEWESNRKIPVRKGAKWLLKDDKKQSSPQTAKRTAEEKKPAARNKASAKKTRLKKSRVGEGNGRQVEQERSPKLAAELAGIPNVRRAPMPLEIHPMLATLVEEPFDDAQWLYEVKWDGYRAVSFVNDGQGRLVSRNQNDLTGDFPEIVAALRALPVEKAVLDGEVVALDEEGRPSFSLMQQRTGMTHPGTRGQQNRGVPIVYYAFDLLYLDGYNLMAAQLEERKEMLKKIIPTGRGFLRYSDHYPEHGMALYRLARDKGLEGIVAKLRTSSYVQKRSREWLKIKITRRQECVIAGYTDPKGSRENFGSIVLGLYDPNGKFVHVGNAGSGFTEATHAALWKKLKELKTDKNPFGEKIESTRKPHWVKPELVAEIKFSEWTHEGERGGIKMRAPIFQGLRLDKKPRECVFEFPRRTQTEVRKAEEEAAI
jgi:bifunctional non-homologous end joining protein LigD